MVVVARSGYNRGSEGGFEKVSINNIISCRMLYVMRRRKATSDYTTVKPRYKDYVKGLVV